MLRNDPWQMPAVIAARSYVDRYGAASAALRAHYDRVMPGHYDACRDLLIWSGHEKGQPKHDLTKLVQAAATRWKRGVDGKQV